MEAPCGTSFTVIVTLSHTTQLTRSKRGDVYVAFQIGDQLQKSSVRLNTRSPKWEPKEHFQSTVSSVNNKDLFVLVCDDRIASSNVMTDSVVSRTDVYGWATIPLKGYVDLNDTKHQGELKEYSLNHPKCRLNYSPTSFICLSIEVVADTIGWHEGAVRVVWENESFVPGSGWVPSVGDSMASPAHFSSEDGRISSPHFHVVTPKMPTGFECGGWTLAVGEGDSGDWCYAPLFLGPWFDQPFDLASARRRKWVNVYRTSQH